MPRIVDIGHVALPAWNGTRVMHMPFHFHDVQTLPQREWRECVEGLIGKWPGGRPHGTGYITIDQKVVMPGMTHRRPGTHIDGGISCGWGGQPPGTWGVSGFMLASSHYGCDAWDVEPQNVGEDGECDTPPEGGKIAMEAMTAYWLAPDTPHRPAVFDREVRRTFLRLSAPNDAPWYEGYTVNPAVPPSGPILPYRKRQMEWDAGK